MFGLEFLFLIVLIALAGVLVWRSNAANGNIGPALDRLETILHRNAQSLREEMSNLFTNFSTLQKNQLDTFSSQLTALNGTTEAKLEQMRTTIENKLLALQTDNNLKLEKMRETVDEKLHHTLEKRLGESFKLVSDRLEQVHKGLGEMQTLANGVGDLKRVLSNVKTRGILGEIQLGNILEQILAPSQYEKNISTKRGSRDVIEFAIALPGKDDSGERVYLPVDSKFPMEPYQVLLTAYESGDAQAVEEAAKFLETTIKKCAKDIRDKYIDPPHTTEFGILFFPTEGLYAESLRRPALMEYLQRELSIMIAGPTTLAAFLNSLQMGFKTLAIEQRSSEVWNVLGAVKTEFGKFGEILRNAQKKINLASQDIDELVGTRTRQIQRKLREVQELPASAMGVLEEEGAEGDDEPA